MTDGSAFRVPMAFLVVLFFAVGLVVSFWVAGIFGMAPPIFWPGVVVLFLLGVMVLVKPKLYVLLLFIYYGFFNGGVILGQYYVSIPFVSVMDELFLAIPLAVIVMKAVSRDLPRGGTWFPWVFWVIVALSAKVNGVPTIMGFRGGLSYFKFFIYWYFARCIGPWSERERRRAIQIFVGFGLIQFIFNIIWQRGLIQRNADLGVGTIGGAHHVAYISVFCLLLVASWLLYKERRLTLFQYLAVLLAMALLSYNSVIFTDAKHVLFLLPFSFVVLLATGQVSGRMKATIFVLALLVAVSGIVYVRYATEDVGGLGRYWLAFQSSAKMSVWHSIWRDVPHDVPLFYILGAGPNNFCSSAAVFGFRPLATKYVLPYVIHGLRMRGNSSASSVIGSVFSSASVLWAEFGPILAILYYGFWFYVAWKLWRRALQLPMRSFDSQVMLALSSCVLFIIMLSALSESFTTAILFIPIWCLVGIFWDVKAPSEVVPTPPVAPIRRPTRLVSPEL